MKTFLEYTKDYPYSQVYGSTVNRTLRIHTNPGKEELHTAVNKADYGILRGITDKKGNMHVWDASHAIHGTVRRLLQANEGEDVDDFYVTRSPSLAPLLSTRDERAERRLSQHPKVMRAFGGTPQTREYDDNMDI